MTGTAVILRQDIASTLSIIVMSNNASYSIHNKLTAQETHETSGGLKFDKKQHTRKTEEIVVFNDNGIMGSKI